MGMLDPNYLGARIKKLIVHPEDPNIVYVACYYWSCGSGGPPVDFGIWKTTDGGSTWAKKFPVSGAGHIAAFCTALALDPKDANSVYTATRDRSIDPDDMPQPGVYVSHDGGGTWDMLGEPDCQDANDPNYPLCRVINSFYCIHFHPTTGDMYVGTPAGTYWWPRDWVLTLAAVKGDPNDPNNVTTELGTIYIDGQEWDPNDTTITYAYGTEIVLNAVPEPNMGFYAWYGDLPDGVNATDPQITVTMDMDREIWALFNLGSCGSGMGMLMIPWLSVAMVSLLFMGRFLRTHR